MSETKSGPFVALLLALADEHVNLLQAAHDQFMDENDHEAASSASIRLERLCMLRSIVQMMTQEKSEQANEPTMVEKITAYLQEYDCDTFPISTDTYEGGKKLLLTTAIGISGDTERWLEAQFPGQIVLSKAPRCLPSDWQEPVSATETAFAATRTPGFRPDREQVAIREDAPAHKREIHPGMPMSGEVQGMPGGKLGDK